MSEITDEELRELEKHSALYPGIINPDVLTRLIASIRYLRQRLTQAEEEAGATMRVITSLKDEMSLRDEIDHWQASWQAAMEQIDILREEHAHYRSRLAKIIGDVRAHRKKRRR